MIPYRRVKRGTYVRTPSVYRPAIHLNNASANELAQNPQAAEFFAGIGLVGRALKTASIDVAWANDIEPAKASLYLENFDSSPFHLGDVRLISGVDVPPVDVFTASFPCTDLSLAGGRRGLDGEQSGLLWEFIRVLEETSPNRPKVVLLENVPGFISSRGGEDLRDAVRSLNRLGYVCDIFQADARWFVPQSRLRVFIVATFGRIAPDTRESSLRPQSLIQFMASNDDLEFQNLHSCVDVPRNEVRLDSAVEKLDPSDERWWAAERVDAFVDSLSELQSDRLAKLVDGDSVTWRTAYRRTRNGSAVWEIRRDPIAGCLRTAGGGSSRQALVEAGTGELRIRWLTGLEYARLQGADDFDFGDARENQIIFGFGDAVCVPVIEWIATEILNPAISQMNTPSLAA